ncbi:hypothetical protein ACBQ54_09480 [Providencia vermicola]|uniref:hypothetical protein n=1 Tax=Providencia vermicola TaxID=333965 RepID=UPI0035247B3B
MPIQPHAPKKNSSISPAKIDTKNEITRSFTSNIKVLKNTQKTHTKNNEKIEINKKTILSLETKLNRMAHITPSFINREKDEIDISIKNFLRKDNKVKSNTDNILKKQNEIIDYFKSKIDETEKNNDLRFKSYLLKCNIGGLKSAIEHESIKNGLSYFKKESTYLKTLEDEVLIALDIEEKNEKLEDLIKIQKSVKKLLIIELSEIKNKINSLKLNHKNQGSYNLDIKSTIQLNKLESAAQNPILIQDSDKQLELNSIIEKLKSSNQNLIKSKDILIESNIVLKNTNAHLQIENQQLKAEKEILARVTGRLYQKNEHITRQEKNNADISQFNNQLIGENKSIYSSNESLNSDTTGYSSESTSSYTSEISISDEKIRSNITNKSVGNTSPKKKKEHVKYSREHQLRCLTAGISVNSTPEKLAKKEAAIKANRTINKK